MFETEGFEKSIFEETFGFQNIFRSIQKHYSKDFPNICAIAKELEEFNELKKFTQFER